jgi:mono/diheme cytochrome c family protein
MQEGGSVVRGKFWILMLSASLFGLFVAAQLWAFPRVARETKTACAACHVNPAGGVDLTDGGKAYKADKKVPEAGAAKAAQYIGSTKCKMCHSAEAKAWAATPHAKALANLKAADEKKAAEMAAKLKIELKGNPASNDAYVTCHVTGFQLAGGYPAADSTKTAAVAMVECEACHGPGSLHVTAAMADKKKLINRGVTANLCTQCHTSDTSPAFKFEEYSQKVHPVPKKTG